MYNQRGKRGFLKFLKVNLIKMQVALIGNLFLLIKLIFHALLSRLLVNLFCTSYNYL
jgi:hypothetical protein